MIIKTKNLATFLYKKVKNCLLLCILYFYPQKKISELAPNNLASFISVFLINHKITNKEVEEDKFIEEEKLIHLKYVKVNNSLEFIALHIRINKCK